MCKLDITHEAQVLEAPYLGPLLSVSTPSLPPIVYQSPTSDYVCHFNLGLEEILKNH